MKITMNRESRVMAADGRMCVVLKGSYEVLDQVDSKVKIKLRGGTIVWADTITGAASKGI